jgi:hypothetical protein
VTLVIDEATERRDIARRIPLGEPVRIREQDIWHNVAANLARETEKGTALGLNCAGNRSTARQSAWAAGRRIPR